MPIKETLLLAFLAFWINVVHPTAVLKGQGCSLIVEAANKVSVLRDDDKGFGLLMVANGEITKGRLEAFIERSACSKTDLVTALNGQDNALADQAKQVLEALKPSTEKK